MQTQGSGHWAEQEGTGSEFRPASQRFKSRDLSFMTVAVSPVTTPADPDWKSKPGSLDWAASTELFNKHVGWKVCAWHWSVVGAGYATGSGDETTLEAAQTAAEAYLRAALGRKHAVIRKVFGEVA
jgi:hypothetical protein